MTDPPSPRPLTDQALSRLRKLAEGNGLAPDQVELVESQEKVYVIEGLTQLVPFCERHPAQYPGPARGSERTTVRDFATLQSEAQRLQQEFFEKRDWLPAALTELNAAPGEGWGLDGAKIALHGKSAILAANETCPGCQGRKLFTCAQCQGQGSVVCTYCQGRGLELCYNCAGSGMNPSQPGQPCMVCQGKRYIPCRFCRASGKLVCPTCGGKRGTPCPQCQGTGLMTQEIALACGATVNFSIKGDNWPSGLRRGLDRLGIINLIKGHADVTRIPDPPPKPDEKSETARDSPLGRHDQPVIIRYRAALPYADLRLRFGGGRIVLVAVFGKRALMMGVPPFLDEALKPWRDKLKQAVEGKLALEKILDARAVKDALTLVLCGQGKPENLRKLYPIGLSPQAMQEILQDIRRALDRFTLHVRTGAAIAGGVAGTLLLAGFLLMPLHAQLTQTLPWPAGLAIDLAALAVAMGIGWTLLGTSVQFQLKRHFPGLKISLHGNAGTIGRMMLTGIGVAWLIMLILVPEKPAWFLDLLGLAIR